MRLSLRPLCFAALLLAGCSESTLPLRSAHDLENYRYDFKQVCFCLQDQIQPVTIAVRDGKVVSVRSRETGADLTRRGNWPTIDDLFDRIEAARRQGTKPLIVELDRELGYPTLVEIGTLANDAGVRYLSSNLRPL